MSPCGTPYEPMPTSCGSDGWSTAILGGDMAYCVKGIACGGTNPAGRDCPGPQPSLPYGSMCVMSDGKSSVKAGLHTCVVKHTCQEAAPTEVTSAPTTVTPVTPAPTTMAPVTPAPTTVAPVTPAPTTPALVTPEPTTPAPPLESQQQEKTPEPTPCATLPYNYGPQSPTPAPTPCKSLPYNYGSTLPTPAPTPCASLPYNYSPKPATPSPATPTTAPAPAPTTKPPTPAATAPGNPTTTPAPAPTTSSPGPQGGSSPAQEDGNAPVYPWDQMTEEAKAPDTPGKTPAPTPAQTSTKSADVPRTDAPQSTPCVYPIKSEPPTAGGKPDASTPDSHSKGAEPKNPTPAPTTQFIETVGAPPSSNGQNTQGAAPATDEPCPKLTLVIEPKAPTPAPATPTSTPCVELTLKANPSTPATTTPAPKVPTDVTPAPTPCEDKFKLKSDAPTPAPTTVTPVTPAPTTATTPVTPAPTTPVTPAPATTAPVVGSGGFVIDPKKADSNQDFPDFDTILKNRNLRAH